MASSFLPGTLGSQKMRAFPRITLASPAPGERSAARASLTCAPGKRRARSITCTPQWCHASLPRLWHHAAPMCCVLALLAFLGPRLVIFLLWLFTNYLSRAFDGLLLPLLGFVFLPWTTIAWSIAQNELGGANGVGLLVIAVGVRVDIGVLGGGARGRR